jgi:hypothetical protein
MREDDMCLMKHKALIETLVQVVPLLRYQGRFTTTKYTTVSRWIETPALMFRTPDPKVFKKIEN